MKKRLLSALLLAALLLSCLAGCGTQGSGTAEPEEPTVAWPQPSRNTWKRDGFPKMDGSTAAVPMAQTVAGYLLGESDEDVADLTQFNRTTQSFRNLMNGECDILMVGEPNASVYTEMTEQGFHADIETVATDALVFVVNESNPINDLSTDQIRAIYTGKVTNWKQLGGADEEITALQRNEGAGSQALMRKLVMKDTELMEAPKDYIISSMGELMEAVHAWDGNGGAIGYSVYYYANDMKMAGGLKILSVDGVEPSAETIRSGDYPHLNSYYCVISSAEPEGSRARELWKWMLTEEAQHLIYSVGYVSVLPFATHVIHPAQREVFTRLREEWIADAGPVDGVACLYPFAGDTLYDTYGNLMGYTYGLADEKGRIVADPTYTVAESVYNVMTGGSMPFYRMGRTGEVTEYRDEEYDYTWLEGDTLYAIVAADGSWATACLYDSVYGYDDCIIAVENSEQNIFTVFDLDGHILFHSDSIPWKMPPWSCYLMYGEGLFLVPERISEDNWQYYYIDRTGAVVLGPYTEAHRFSEGLAAVSDKKSGKLGYIDKSGKWVIPASFYSAEDFADGQALVTTGISGGRVITRKGTVLLEADSGYLWRDGGTYVVSPENGTRSWYTLGGEHILTEPSNYVYTYTGMGWNFTRSVGQNIELFDPVNGTSRVYDCEYIWPLYSSASRYTESDILEVYSEQEDFESYDLILLDADLNEHPMGTGWVNRVCDGITGDEYIVFTDENSGLVRVYDTGLRLLAEVRGTVNPFGGALMITDSRSCRLMTLDGAVFFRKNFTAPDD